MKQKHPLSRPAYSTHVSALSVVLCSRLWPLDSVRSASPLTCTRCRGYSRSSLALCGSILPSSPDSAKWLLELSACAICRPLATTCRIWDRVLDEGERTLFCAAVAVMQAPLAPSLSPASPIQPLARHAQLLQPILLTASFEECLSLLQNLPQACFTRCPTLLTYPELTPSNPLQEGTILRESTLLTTMSRVQLPAAQYERLLLQCAVESFS